MLLDRYKIKLYQSGLKMVMYVACKELFKCDVFYMHSLDKGLYCKINTSKKLTDEDITKLKIKMQKIIDANEKITKKVVIKKDAYNYYLKIGAYEKASNILYLNNKTVTLYELHGYYNYFMGNMFDSTGKLNKFDITYLGNN